MKNSFLYECAEKIIASNYSFDEIKIVVPNERTKIYLNSAFAKSKKKAQWAPAVLGMKEIACQITGMQPENKITLIFKLYDIFKKIATHATQLKYNLETFYGLGETILNDFNEIDNWLVDPKDVFKNIEDISEIDRVYEYLTDEQKQTLKEYHLLFSEEQRSDEKEKTHQLRLILPKLYEEYTKTLKDKKIGYNGIIMREMSNRLEQNKAVLKAKQYFFIGFNALTASEMSLVYYLKKQNKAQYFQDDDPYYVNDKKQEAGHFLRINKAKLNLEENLTQRIPDKNTDTNRTIKLYPVPQNIAQSKIIPHLLKDIPKPSAETVIILSDESMMLPVLHAIPDHVEELNVSMGSPLKETKLFSLIRQYIKIHKTDDITICEKIYTFDDFQTIIKHPLIYPLISEIADELLSQTIEKQMATIPARMIIEQNNEILKTIFAGIPAENSNIIFLNNLLNLLILIFQREEDDHLVAKKTLENEAIHLCYKNIKKLKELLDKRHEKFSITFTSNLLLQIISELSIPFRGKKISGLQIMGVLETRNIDFENVILLGMNEGQFPKINHYKGFLSYSIRYAFNLPLIQHQDAVYAYLFYRLLHRSKNISIIYKNQADEQTGEMSRFVKQLKYESGFKFETFDFFQQLKIKNPQPLSIPKSHEVMMKIEEYNLNNNKNARRFSASALSTLIACNLHFYFKYIAKIKEPELPENEISPAVFGNILHKSAEIIYKKLSHNNKTITKTQLSEIKKNLPEYILQAIDIIYEKHPNKELLTKGKGQIILEVLAQYLKIIIDEDIKYTPFQIISLEEKKYTATFDLDANGTPKKIQIFGIIDRLDFKDGILRIIDYKTGNANKQFTSVEELFKSEKIIQQKPILQMYLYAIMLWQNTNHKKITAGIYDIKKMTQKSFSPYIKMKGTKENPAPENIFPDTFNDFIVELKEIISNLFNPDIFFSQTDNEEHCTFCPYKSICSRD